jgi:hypothetical protein
MPILTDDRKQVVQGQRLAYIATVCSDGTPNLSPKGTIRVWDDDHLVFAEICSPGTIENLRNNPSIEINTVDVFARKGYRFKGTATILSQGAKFDSIMGLYSDRSQGTRSGIASLIRNMVMVRVDQAKPLLSPGYLPGVTEEQMRRQWQEHYLAIQP